MTRRAPIDSLDPIDTMTVIVEVWECMPEDRARRIFDAMGGKDGVIRCSLEDRNDDGEGWATVVYWAPGFADHRGYAMRVRVADFEGVAVGIGYLTR